MLRISAVLLHADLFSHHACPLEVAFGGGGRRNNKQGCTTVKREKSQPYPCCKIRTPHVRELAVWRKKQLLQRFVQHGIRKHGGESVQQLGFQQSRRANCLTHVLCPPGIIVDAIVI